MGNIGAVFLFEWKRSLTVPRMAWWLVLAGFPVFIIGIIRLVSAGSLSPPPPQLWIGFLFGLCPMLVTMLGAMLWVTPAVSAELERRSWVYLAVRPYGGEAVLLGKYLAAVTWVIPPVLLGLTIAVPLSGVEPGFQIWWALTRLVLLSTPAYTAVYLVLGTILPRRGLVLAVGYSLVFELVISFVPAVINKLTVHHRLQALLLWWCQLEIPVELTTLFGNTPPWQHVIVLMLYPPVLVAAAIGILRFSEFSSAAESDV